MTFTPKPRKQRARREAAAVADASSSLKIDSNALLMVPPNASKTERDEQKRALKESIRSQQAHKPSAKKQKRLDKYIENKLKRDEKLEIIRLLEHEKEKEDLRKAQEEPQSTASTCSGAKLGAEKPQGKRKRGHEEAIGVSAADRSHGRSKRRRRKAQDEGDSDGSDGEGSVDSLEAEHPELFSQGTDLVSSAASTAPAGSGLAQPLEIGQDGLPIIQVKPGRKKRQKISLQRPHEDSEEERASESYEDDHEEAGTEEESDWDGFSDTEAREQNQDDDRARKMRIIEQILAQEETESDASHDDSSADESDLAQDEHSSDVEDQGTEAEGTDSDNEQDTDTDSTEVSTTEKPKPRVSAFKSWATQALNRSLGHTPSYETGNMPNQTNSSSQASAPRLPTVNPVLGSIPLPTAPTRKAHAVYVERTADIEASRSELPILQREQEIMEAVYNNSVIIIKGDTGSGKTTQIPQFLYEAGFGLPDGPTPGMIGITQPRRVAAMSMAKRVGDELGDHGSKVAYQIRFDSNVSARTTVKFMTDGILLRELSQDLLLKKYSVIVIDEAHERSVNTDLLIGILSKVVPARLRKTKFNPDPKPLKLIIMSATLNLSDFLNDRLFDAQSKPPVVEAEGRQHRVTTHFALRTRPDYVEEVVEKIRRAHRKLPRGGMLVFLTGQNEIRQVGERLQKLLGRSDEPHQTGAMHITSSDVPQEVEDMEIETITQKVSSRTLHDDFDEVEFVTGSDDEEEEDEFDISDEDEADSSKDNVVNTVKGTNGGRADSSHATPGTSTNGKQDPYTTVHILPLYSQLPTKQQLLVFEPSPANARLIVLATNVAETSLTIPGIRYVFDTGRSKERKYNLTTGVQSFEIDWISKASAAQRAGRAGRTGPGHCWRLYTSAVYEQFFPEHAEPEILRAPVEGIVLQLKSIDYPKAVTEFPFPSSPERETLEKAERLLKNLGALTAQGKTTDLGKELSVYPLSPRLGKMLYLCVHHHPALLTHIVALVSGLAIQEIFYTEAQLDLIKKPEHEQDGKIYLREQQQADEERDQRKQAFGRARATLSKMDKHSDALKLLTAVTMYSAADDKEAFCKQYFLRSKAMFEVSQLQRQLLGIIQTKNPELQVGRNPHKPLSSKHSETLNSIAAAGYVDQVAIRADLAPTPPEMLAKPRRAIDVPYLPLIPLAKRPTASLLEKAIFIHPSSLLAKQPHKDLPRYIIYSHLQKSQVQSISNGETTVVPKTRMFPITPLDGRTLVNLTKDTALLEYGRVVTSMKVEELGDVPKRRVCWVTTELKGAREEGTVGSMGWPLPAVRVRQVLDLKASSGWRVEEVLH